MGVALLPIAALFSALCLALAAFARSTKEGQCYLMPLLMLTMPLVILPMAPGVELNVGNSLIPVTGIVLLLRSVLEGDYWQAAQYSPIVAAVTLAACLMAIRWAIEQFNSEAVLFRESERLGFAAVAAAIAARTPSHAVGGGRRLLRRADPDDPVLREFLVLAAGQHRGACPHVPGSAVAGHPAADAADDAAFHQQPARDAAAEAAGLLAGRSRGGAAGVGVAPDGELAAKPGAAALPGQRGDAAAAW